MREWILQRYHTYARVCLYTGLFLAPVMFHRSTIDVFNLVKVTILWVLGLAAFGLWVMRSVERGRWVPRFSLLSPAGAFLAAGALATIFSENPALSLIGLYHRYGGLLPFALYAVIMVLIVALYWERPADLKEIARASAAASILCAAYVLIQAAGQDWIDWRDPSGKPPEFPVGTLGNSNFAGGYLGIAVPFFMYVARTARRPVWRSALTLMVGLDVLAVWFTQTRGGMIAAGTGLMAMALMYRDRIPRWIKAGLAVAVAAVAVVAFIVLFHPGSERAPEPLARLETFRTGTFTIRSYYWGTAWRIFSDNPVVGTGLETYFANYPKYRLIEDGRDLGLTITDKPHNIFLEYAANSGIIGLGTYLVLIGMALWYGYRKQGRLEGQPRLLLVTFTAVLAGYLGQGFFSIDVPPLAVMGWVALGGIAAIADPLITKARLELREQLEKERKANAKTQKNRGDARRARVPAKVGNPHPVRVRTAWGVHAAVAAGLAPLVFFGVRPVFADVKAKSAESTELAKGPRELVIRRFEEAVRLHPLEPTYRARLGQIAEAEAIEATDVAQRKALFGEALDRFRQALRLQPGNIFYLMDIARVYTSTAESVDASSWPDADRWWRRAAEHDPTDYIVQNSYALMLNSWANAAGGDQAIRRRTAEQLERVVRIKPDYVPAWINLGKVYRALGQTAKAQEALRKAVKIEPSNQEAQELLAAN